MPPNATNFSLSFKFSKFYFCLQETHYCATTNAKRWEQEWPGKSFWAGNSTNQAECAILISPNLSNSIIFNSSSRDIGGRYVVVDFEFHGETFKLLNLYAYNDATRRDGFFKSLSKLCPSSDKNFIMCGDYNMVMDLDNDRVGGHPSPHPHTVGKIELQKLLQKSDLVDVCHHHQISNSYTWHSRQDAIYSRLDRIYISKHLGTRTSKPKQNSYRNISDHDMFTCILNFVDRGPGFWKLNTEILSDAL